ncbi:MAG: hypothetical protein MJA31_10740 [Clostridia bacterium]|nr:hypothetical protein [Clostridia bacterium]
MKNILKSKTTAKWWEVLIALLVLTFGTIFLPEYLNEVDKSACVGISTILAFLTLFILRIIRSIKKNK